MHSSRLIAIGCALALAALLFMSIPAELRAPAKPAAASAPAEFVISNARVFDGETTWPRADVHVKDGLIIAIDKQLEWPSDLVVIDGSGKTLLPGLIDAHVHSWGEARQQMLRFGVTTALDMFTNPIQLSDFRRERSSLAATDRADVWSAGNLVTARGGHGTQFGMKFETFDHASQAPELVASRVVQGSDFIKFVVDDGHAYGDGHELPTLDATRITALLAATRAAKQMAVAHVAQVDTAVAVLQAGADGLVHVFSDRQASADEIAMMAASGGWVIPTLTVISGLSGQSVGPALVADTAIAPLLDAAQRDTLRATYPPQFQDEKHLPNALANVAALHRAGVDILAGTDAGNPGTAHGASLHGELELLVSAGLSPTAALRAATALPAKHFGLLDRGHIAIGLRADLLLIDGDPTTDIRATRRLAMIWKNGIAVARQSTSPPATQEQANPPLAAITSPFARNALRTAQGQHWAPSTDTFVGGKSTSVLTLESAGDNRFMHATGAVATGTAYPWAGAALLPGDPPMSASNASQLIELSFVLRGDGRELLVMLLTGENNQAPAMQRIVSTKDWQTHRFQLAAFQGADLTRLRAIAITASLPAGEFAFDLDDFELH